MSTCNNSCPVWDKCRYEHKGWCDCVMQRKFKPTPEQSPAVGEAVPPPENDLQFRLVRALLIDAWLMAWSKHPGTKFIREAVKSMTPNEFPICDTKALRELRDSDLSVQKDLPRLQAIEKAAREVVSGWDEWDLDLRCPPPRKWVRATKRLSELFGATPTEKADR